MRLFASRSLSHHVCALGRQGLEGFLQLRPWSRSKKCPVRECFRTGHRMVASIFDRHLQDPFSIGRLSHQPD